MNTLTLCCALNTGPSLTERLQADQAVLLTLVFLIQYKKLEVRLRMPAQQEQ